jgi:hypothetical protein
MTVSRDIARALDPVAFARACRIDPDPWQATLLLARPKRTLILASRQVGKTLTTALMALHRAAYEAGSLIVVVSPSQRQSAEMLRTIRLLHSRLDDAPELGAESVLKIELKNKSRILALPGTEKTIRGLGGASLLVVDECARCEESLLAAIRPMIATRPDAGLIFLSTPAGRRGFFFESWQNGGDDWHRVRVLASDCPRISPEFLAEERKNLGPTVFASEYGLEFTDTTEAMFLSATIEAAFEDFPPLWRS